MTEQRKKTTKQDGNIRYLCPSCHEPSIQPSTLPMIDFICPKMGELVTVNAIKSAFRLPNPYR